MLSAYPSITPREFEEAGKTLEHICSASSCTGQWLEVSWATGELHVRQRQSILQQTHELLSEKLEDNSETESEGIVEVDKETLIRRQPGPLHIELIDYSIVLSPTYQVPVLWFSSPSIAATKAGALDLVYEQIVSPGSRVALQQVGVLGGISIAEHPLDGLPAFFIHPCMTQETLNMVRPKKDISPVEYLMLWFGIIASPVGLSVPLEIAKLLPGQEDTR